MALVERRPRRAPLITFMFVRSATPHLSAAAEQQSRQPDDVGGDLPCLVAGEPAWPRRVGPGSSSK